MSYKIQNAFQNGDYKTVIEESTKAIEKDPGNHLAIYFRGLAYLQLGRYEEALKEFAWVLSLVPGFKEVKMARAQAFYELNQLDKALAEIKTLHLDNNPGYLYGIRASIYAKGKQYDKAIQELKDGLHVDPSNENLKYALSHYESVNGNTDESIKIMTPMVTEKSLELASVLNNRGYYHGVAGNLEAAVQDCTRAIELNPELALAHNSRAHAYFLMGRLDDALTGFQKALTLLPQKMPFSQQEAHPYIFSHIGIAITHHKQGNSDEAKRTWKKLLENYPEYDNIEEVMDRYHPAPAFIAEAEKVIALLQTDNPAASQ